MPLLLVGGLAAVVLVAAAIIGSGTNPLAGPSARGAAAMNAARRQIQGQGGAAGRQGNTGAETIGTFLGFGTEGSPSGYSTPPGSIIIGPPPGGPGTQPPAAEPITTPASSSFTAAPPPYEEPLVAPSYSWTPGAESTVAPGQTPIFYSDPVTGATSATPQPGYAPIY